MFFIRVIQDEFNKDLIFKLNSEADNNDFYLKINDLMADMLSLFCTKNNVFFCLTEYDKDLDPNKEDIRNEFFEDFYNGNFLDENKYLSNDIKETLYNYYYKSNDKNNISDIENIKENLLKKFRQIPIQNIDEYLKNSISDFLYDKLYVSKLTDYPQKIQKFVNEKLIVFSNEWEFPYSKRLNFEKNPSYIRDLWIKLDDKKDILKWFENFYREFTCVITKDSSIYDYSYYLTHTFEEWDTGEQIVIQVLEKEKGSFLNDVFPILKQKFNNKIELINNLK